MDIFVNLVLRTLFNNFRQCWQITYSPAVCLVAAIIVLIKREILIYNALTEDSSEKRGNKISIKWKYFNWYIILWRRS